MLPKKFFQIEKQNWLKTREMTQDDLLNPKNWVRTDLAILCRKNFFKIELAKNAGDDLISRTQKKRVRTDLKMQFYAAEKIFSN